MAPPPRGGWRKQPSAKTRTQYVSLYNCRVAGQKFYVVWRGRKRGIFSSWAECEKQVSGFVGAQFKAFESRAEAERAFAHEYAEVAGRPASLGKWKTAAHKPQLPSICVDAACDGSPGILEYQGVMTETGARVFKAGPFRDGTNNVGEFLAIVEALRWLKSKHLGWPVYSDSSNAIGWVAAGKCNTKLKQTPANERLFEMIRRAEEDLRHERLAAKASVTAGAKPTVMKWDTSKWGEIPADFGRK